jgi:16S rRNA (cytosine967-C5)-methyltransferase
MSKTDKPLSSRSWQASVRVVEEFLKTDSKLDALFSQFSNDEDGGIRHRIQYLSYGVIRNLGFLHWCLSLVVKKAPKKRLQAILLVAIFEWLEADDDTKPQVVHHAVEQSKGLLSKPETRFVNAVLRKFPSLAINSHADGNSPASLGIYYSHPGWMVKRWLKQYGLDATRAFLEWNQQTPKVFAWSPVPASELPGDWKGTDWSGFYEVQDGDWTVIRSWLDEGKVYIQDPSTRLGPTFLIDLGVGSILDLCAAPGGKSVQLQRYLKAEGGLLVSVDLPGQRFERLQENLARYQVPGVKQLQIGKDVLALEVDDLPQPEFDAVYVDVPCSNTGVLQRRPDVKWRQTSDSVRGLKELQMAFLTKAAKFVKTGGWVIYSTCSVERDENDSVVAAFLADANGKFTLEKTEVSLPWETGHDGAFACLLRRLK